MRKIFLDLGAWNGNSITHFRAMRPDGDEFKIYSFECHPVSLKRLRKNVFDVAIIDKAVWVKDCDLVLISGQGRFVESSTIVKSKKVKGHKPECDCIVECIDFSKWIKENLKPDDYVVVKFNIEGAEYKVIEHLCQQGTINYFKEMYIEWHYKKMEMSEEEHSRYLNMIPSHIKVMKWELDHTKRAIYTAICGNNKYVLREPTRVATTWDYICFTDLNPEDLKSEVPLKDSIWEIRHPPGSNTDGAKFSRQIKILHDQYLPDYKLSLYIDTRFRTSINVDRFVKANLINDIAVMTHNRRTCLYKEAEYLLHMPEYAKISDVIRKQVAFYKSVGMPEDYGLWAPGIMIRRHGVEKLFQMMRMWYEQMALYSPRDQLSFAYSKWRNRKEVVVGEMPFGETYKSFIL